MGQENTLASLPRIVQFLSTDREGFGAECPHCGALGSIVHTFRTEDNQTRGAMSGCIKLFPIAPIAYQDLKLRKKRVDYEKKGWKLPSWDEEKQKAIEAFYANEITEDRAMVIIRCAEGRAANYRKRRFGGR
jgi:hypothetical protein